MQVAIHPDDLPRILETFREALNSVKPYEVEAASAASTANFAGFSFAVVLCATDRESREVVRNKYRS